MQSTVTHHCMYHLIQYVSMWHDFMYRYLNSWGTCKLMYRYVPMMCVAWLLHVPVWLCVYGRNMISCTSMCPCMWHDNWYMSMYVTWLCLPVCAVHGAYMYAPCNLVPMHVAWQPIYVHVCDMIVFTGMRCPWGIHVCTMHAIIHAGTGNHSSYNPIRGHPGPSVASFTISDYPIVANTIILFLHFWLM